jgi:hypothetical protein
MIATNCKLETEKKLKIKNFAINHFKNCENKKIIKKIILITNTEIFSTEKIFQNIKENYTNESEIKDEIIN